MAYQTHMDSSMVDDSAPLSDTNGIELPPDILVLHLIATGVIQLTDRVAKGMPIDSQYPVPLQIGLNRLNVIRYRHSLHLVRSIPDLLSWCRRPLRDWPLDIALAHLDPDETLLDNQFPTSVCESLACATSDVEADLSERRFISSVFNTCQAANSPGTYVTFRRLLIEHPVLTEFELLWLKRGLRRFVTLPGLAEIRLERRLLKLKLKVELWPEFDSYDLHIEFPDGKAWAVDVKDWANPFLLALRVKNIPLNPPLEMGYFVFPDERSRQSDYVRAFRNTCNSRKSSGKVVISGRIQAKFERHFLADVKKRLAACKGVNDA